MSPEILPWLSGLNDATYFEPFAGGAALFFALEHRRAVLSDTNAELMQFYAVVRDFPKQLISRLRRMQNSSDDYYSVRASKPTSAISRAARFYYLTRLAFNGIYRENLSGEFNVPYGYKTHLNCVDAESVLEASRLLNAARLYCADFRKVVALTKPGDIVYFDPPYTVRHNNNGFIKYNRHLFSWEDQIALAKAASLLDRGGCHVVVSNAAHEEIRALYGGFQHIAVSRHSVISAQARGRAKTSESLFVSESLNLKAAHPCS